MALNLSLRLSLAHLAYALLIIHYCSSSSSSAVDLLKGSTNPRRPMILPLYLSSSKTTSSSTSTSDRIIADHNRRQLRNSPPPPNARMRLYDDLLANGFNSQFYLLLLLLLLLFSFLLLWFWFWFWFFFWFGFVIVTILRGYGLERHHRNSRWLWILEALWPMFRARTVDTVGNIRFGFRFVCFYYYYYYYFNCRNINFLLWRACNLCFVYSFFFYRNIWTVYWWTLWRRGLGSLVSVTLNYHSIIDCWMINWFKV